MSVTSFVTSLVRKEQISSDAWNFYFKKPKSFHYEAGQYIKMWMEIVNPDNRGVSRYFTISASPTEEHLMFTTRIIKSTFKKTLDSLPIGSKVKMRGPWGDFVFHKDVKKPLVFIAGGIGITPFHSLLRFAADSKIDTDITLFMSVKTPDELFYMKEFNSITAINKNIKIITTVTESENTEWKGQTGRINAELLQKHLDSLSNYVYYIAGPDPLVEAIEKMLVSLKIKKEDILIDGFPGY